MALGQGLRTERTTIAGMDIAVTQFPPLRALALQCRLLKIIGPALAAVDGDLESLLERNVSALGPVLAMVFGRLDGQEAQELARDILACTTVTTDGKILALDRSEAIDAVFAGRLRAMLEALGFALKVNYADFFGNAPGESLAAGPMAALHSSSTKTSQTAGQSGGSGSRGG